MSSEAFRGLTLFDPLAPAYEGWFATRLGAFVARRETALLLRLLRARAGETVLEVGSGTGYFLRAVAGTGARCVGLEPSREMLALARAQPAANLRLVRGRGEALPFRNGCFDALLYMTTLEFVQDVDEALQEARRAIRPGGRLVFGVLNADGPWARARRNEGGLWAEARFFSSGELRTLLASLGEVRLDYTVHVPPRLGWLPAPLMGIVDVALKRIAPNSGALIGAIVTQGRPG